MTSALNATIVTGNGNEMILQNDMGNTLIQDSRTGHIIGLSDGFIPLGIREYGGIIYIASVNPHTNQGELGSIPSPLILYTYRKDPQELDKIVLSDISDTQEDSIQNHINPDLTKLVANKLQVGDKFIICLDLSNIEKLILRKDEYEENKSNPELKRFPLFTTFDTTTGKKIQGYYRLDLYARLSSGKDIKLSTITDSFQLYYTESDLDLQTSKYWFINASEDIVLDEDRNTYENLYRTYPNIPSGYLAVKLEVETPKDIQLLINTSTGIPSPFTYVVNDGRVEISQNYLIPKSVNDALALGTLNMEDLTQQAPNSYPGEILIPTL